MSDSTQQSNHNKSEKFLHLFWEFPPFIQGGLGVAGRALCDALASYGQLDIVCPETPAPMKDYFHPYTIFQIKMPSQAHLHTAYASHSDDFSLHTNEQINSFSKGVTAAHFTGYSSIHAHDWITADAAKSIQTANLPAHTPIILHIHSTQIDRVGSQSNGAIFAKEKIAMQDADEIITVSETTKTTITDNYQIAPDRITVIRNAIERLSIPTTRLPHPPTLLFVARMEPQKSPLFALEIISATLKKVPQARAIIAGKGSLLETMRNLVKFKKMDDRIEVLGHIPHEKMHLVYQVSDVLILPSAAEPFGLVALEAAQSGAAVILSDRCGAGEALSSAPQLPLNTTTSFSSWVETTVNLLTDHSLRDQQVAHQTKQLETYSWDDAAKKLLSTLEI